MLNIELKTESQGWFEMLKSGDDRLWNFDVSRGLDRKGRAGSLQGDEDWKLTTCQASCWR